MEFLFKRKIYLRIYSFKNVDSIIILLVIKNKNNLINLIFLNLFYKNFNLEYFYTGPLYIKNENYFENLTF
jgi:hypothetical protein